jgi:tetratricopeptide (TPR) repeat protein
LVAEVKQLAEWLLAALPGNPQALVLAGRIYYAFNDVARADDCWQSCLQLHPGFAEAQCAVAEAAWEHGDFEQAAQRFSEAFADNPQLNQQQVFCLADALMNLGRAPEAVAVLERSAEHHPLPPSGMLLLAHACVESGQFEKALPQFNTLLAANPQSAKAHFGLAAVYTQLGNPLEASRHREQYAKLQKDEFAESARLRPEIRKRDWADPIPVVRESYLNAGKVFATLNKLDETEKLWRRAAELDPASPRPRQLLELLKLTNSGGHAADER